MKRRLKKILKYSGVALLFAAVLVIVFLPDIGAAILLHPPRKPFNASPPAGCVNVTYDVDGVRLEGWSGKSQGKARGTVIFLHGMADNRAAGAGICERFLKKGFDVIAYDSRAHGASGGDACTYGFHEKHDLLSIVSKVEHPPVVLLGCSMGAAVALQAAGMSDKGIATVIAAETFSDLESVSRDRVPSFLMPLGFRRAIEKAEREGNFKSSEVSPMASAAKIKIPVLIIHGAKDKETPPAHSQRVFQNLRGTKNLILVPDAGHGQSLGGTTWSEIEAWIHRHVPR
jgi:alpha-beta hydrolase superfamily lysophospholipase